MNTRLSCLRLNKPALNAKTKKLIRIQHQVNTFEVLELEDLDRNQHLRY